MGRTVVEALAGFIFWAIAANFYSAEDVGLAAAVISACGLLGLISHLGMGFGLIRFLPGAGKEAPHTTNFTFTLTTLMALAVALIFLLGLDLWSPTLTFLRDNAAYFLGFLAFATAISLAPIVDQTFVAKRAAKFVLFKASLSGVTKIVIVATIATVGAFGIFAAQGFALLLAIIVSLFIFLPRIQKGYRPWLKLRYPGWRNLFGYSLANFAADILGTAPSLIFPLLVVNILGAEMNAYFYIAWLISNFLMMIPFSISTSLFAEGSHDEKQFISNAWRSIRLSLGLLLPVLLGVFSLGGFVLSLFGEGYSENATHLLWILSASAIPYAVIAIYFAHKRVTKDIRSLTIISAAVFILQLGLSYPLMNTSMGILGVGVAVAITQSLVAACLLVSWYRQRRAIARQYGGKQKN